MSLRHIFAAALAVLLFSGSALAQPDVRQMSGMPLPVADMAPATVSVRVVKGALTNPIKNQPVVLTGAGTPITVNTNDAGRAEFTTLTPGTRAQVQTTVDGEVIESQQFEVPRAGGIRLMLVATDAALAKEAVEAAKQPAQPGEVALGSESRLVFEIGEDGLNVFNMFQIVNAAKTPVQPAGPVVFDLPAVAEHASLMEGSTPQAAVAGKRVTVNGPFAPGNTVLQFAYTIEFGRGEMTVEQKLPLALPQLTVIMQKIGEMHMTSPQFAQHRDMNAEGGTYIFAQGPALKAGAVVQLNFTGLPHESTWPRNLALALAGAILIAGIWGAVRARRQVSPAPRKLQAERDRLFAQLTQLEEEHRRGAVPRERYQARRRDLIAALERVYAQLDGEAAA